MQNAWQRRPRTTVPVATARGPAPDVAMILLNNSGVGGAERRFAQVYRRLKRRGVPISLIINESLLGRLRQGAILTEEDEPALVIREPMGRIADRLWGPRMVRNVRVSGRNADKGMGVSAAFWCRKLDYVTACLTVRRWLVKCRPQLMHVILGGAYVALPAQWFGGAPPAVVSVVCPSLRGTVGAALGCHLYRSALRRARMVDALTDDVATMARREGVPAGRVRVSPGSCVDTDRFSPQALRKPWVVFSGRFIDEKNPALFVEACALVHERVPEARFFMFGEGPLHAAIQELVCSHKLEECFEIGWSLQVEAVLSEALVFASLQHTDNYPSQALLEAMACGTAIVATDVGLTWKLVNEAVGFRVKPSPVSVAGAITTLLEDRSLAASLGRRARDRVIGLHSMEAYADYLENLYAETATVAKQRK